MLGVVFSIALALSGLTSSLTLDTPNPAFGQQITFTGTYGKVYHGRQPQLPNQPQVQVNCTLDADGSGWQDSQWTWNKTNLGNGWAQSTYVFTLSGGGNGQSWTSGGATCGASLFYFDADFKLYQLGYIYFTVSS